MNAETVFLNAVEIEDESQRREFVEQIFRQHPVLRDPVETLLRLHLEAGSFLERPLITCAPPTTGETLVNYQPGDFIGPYQLLQKIAQGGMGIVYVALQNKPVQRRVALKIIKPGISSSSIIGRFEVERQTLALMDHPNIARVFDAGATESGQLYFVMELINGIPITEYCDRARMTTRQRLELMIPVCEAVQHAHQKAIIHRDIKPSNVLVTEYDDRPVPKIIDFGVAKALGSRLDESAMHTEFGQVIGTLEYMSPEQAGLNQLDVDTRSDIYALGVMLYELLTGTTPLERGKCHQSAIMELLRVIREVEPQRPSTRLSSTAQAPLIAANRSTEPSRLSALMRGELDWIAMKALEKDRKRRYQSAGSLAHDIQRFLHDEPVEARPASALYRLRKFARRNRSAVLLTCSLLTLVTVIAVGSWLYHLAALETLHERAESAHARLVNEAHETIPEIEQSIRNKQFEVSVMMLNEIEQLIPDYPGLPELWERCSQTYTIQSQPPGAEIWRRRYDAPGGSWTRVVRADETIAMRVPLGEFLWKASKPGCLDTVGLRPPGAASFSLEQIGAVPDEMIRIPGGCPATPGMEFQVEFKSVDLPEFLIDRCEVSNIEYAQFVNAGGYDRTEFWQDLPFTAADGSVRIWEQIKPLLVDQTGNAGPSTWSSGTYGDGEGNFPVQGVNWFEAMAYARFAGKSLPTIYHWTQASQVETSVALAGDAFITQSNFTDQLQPVNGLTDFNFFGINGVMGNVREWCANSNSHGDRFVLGGGCDDPIYVPLTLPTSHPLVRSRLYGFRCVKFVHENKGPDAAWQSCQQVPTLQPPSAVDLLDARTFQLVVEDRFIYDHDQALDVTVETIDEGGWVHEIVQLNTAYHDSHGGWERMAVHIYLPKGIDLQQGYQAVVYFPARDGWMLPHLRPLEKEYELDRLVRSGRAVVRPVFYGNHERRQLSQPVDVRDWEEVRCRIGLDLMRTVDYLLQRGDINMEQLCYYGFSFGAEWAGSLVAVEPRFRAAVFEAGGLENSPLREEALFLEWRHCLPQIRIPVLMINGQNDTIYPVAEAQQPMFELLGSSDKEHFVYPGGHHMLPPEVKFKKMTAWLDQHFGAPQRRE